MTTIDPPADQAARTRILEAHGETLFVQAGAGTGKTTALVARVVEMIATGAVEDVSRLAAITFTENAAGELRTRLRAALADAARGGHRDRVYAADHRARASAALDRFDDAAVSTLHGFASRLLSEVPLEADLPPGFTVRDPITAQVEQAAAWRRFVDDLLDDATLADHLSTALTLGLTLPALRTVSESFAASWDLVSRRPFRRVPLPTPDTSGITAPLRVLAADAERWPEGDKLTEHLRRSVLPVLDQLDAGAAGDGLLDILVRVKLGSGNVGSGPAWSKAGLSKPGVVERLKDADAARAAALAATSHSVATTLASCVQDHVLAEVDRRRTTGRLDFHDLLVLTRDVLRDHEGARELLRARWNVIMVDEFQDTDPLQVEIVDLLAAARPQFFVGDPKQSIYRFRRADVELYSDVRGRHPSGQAELAVNFRSVPGILHSVNLAFRQLLGDGPMAFADLLERRPPTGDGAAVTRLGGPGGPADNAGTLRAREAEHVADVLARAHDEWWVAGQDGPPRHPQFSDIAILMPTRVSLPAIEAALQSADIPYRIESRSLIWSTDAVRDVVTILQSIDNPADAVATVTALRHPGLACSDVDLAEWSEAGGSWNYLAPTPPGLSDHPVAAGMAVLRRVHDLRWWLPVHELVALVVRELRLVELTAGLRRPRDHWRRLRFIVDQARAFGDAGGSGLGVFVDWALAQQANEADVLETAVPEPDDDAVRILTVHGAKGLEFPVTAVVGLGSGVRVNNNVLWTMSNPQVRLRKGTLETGDWDTAQALEKALAEAEARRVLYVAMTRACDHLVLGCYYKPGNGELRSHAQRLAELLPETTGLVRVEPALPARGSGGAPPRAAPRPTTALASAWVPDFDHERAALLDGVQARTATSPTALVAAATRGGPSAPFAARASAPFAAQAGSNPPDPEPRRRDADAEPVGGPAKADGSLPPARHRSARQSAGAAIGSAVHRVLELLETDDTEETLTRLATAACGENDVPEAVNDVLGRARTALASQNVLAELSSGAARREVYLVVPDGERFVEGYIDLLAQQAEELVVFDYKTDRARTPQERAAKEALYAPQLAAYTRMVERVTGRPTRAALVFASPPGGEAG